MKLQFTNLEIEGFLSIGKASIDLNKIGTTIIYGSNRNPSDNAASNGAGKSAIFEAIFYAITGLTIRGIKDKEVVNRNYPMGCCVELTITKGTDEYKIRRTRDHQIHGTTIKLFLNGDDVSNKNMSDNKDLITRYLPELSSDIVGSVLILGQGLPHRLTKHTPSGRKQLLENVSGTNQVLSEVNDRISSRVKFLKSESQQLHDQKTSWTSEIASFNRIIEDTKKVVENHNPLKLEADTKNAEQKLISLSADLDAIEASILTIKQEISKYESNSTTVYTRLAQLRAQYNMNKKDLDRLGTGVCPTCNRPLDNANELRVKKDELTRISLELEAKIKIEDSTLSEITSQLNYYKEGLSEAERMRSATMRDITSYNQILSNCSSIRGQLDQAQDTINKYQELVNDRDLALIELCKLIGTNEANMRAIGYLDRALSKEFKTYMLSSVIEFLDTRAKHYGSKFFTDGMLKIYADKNSIEIEVGNKSYEALSGGERQKVDLAIQFAMRDMMISVTGLHCNILILDEIFDNLDGLGCESLLNILVQDLGSIDSVFIITHHADIPVPHDHTLEVIKNEIGLSEINYIEE